MQAKTIAVIVAESLFGGRVAGFHTVREAKCKVEFAGRVKKEVFAAYRVAGKNNGGAYQSAVNRRRAEVDIPQDFIAKPINGGAWRAGFVGRIIDYFNGNVCVRVYATKNRQRVYWILDGVRVPYSAVEHMLLASEKPATRKASREATAAHQGVDLERAVFPISISESSIRRVKCGDLDFRA